MKTFKLYTAIALFSLGMTACDKELKEDAELDVSVAATDGVNFDGKTVTVKKGTSVSFLFNGDPDFITFYSGEPQKEYKYRDRIMMEPEDLATYTLSFGVTAMGGSIGNADISINISDQFPGIAKNNFDADKQLLEEYEGWTSLLDKSSTGEYPSIVWSTEAEATKRENVKWLTHELKSYQGKEITLAIHYEGQKNTSAQPKFFFMNMKMIKTFTNGETLEIPVNNFGFTPVNVCRKENYADQFPDKVNYICNLPGVVDKAEYGYVTNNVPGIWKLNDFTKFTIHSSAKNMPLKFSWLVSDPISIDASCYPDTGNSIKNITQSLSSYAYTYETAGTYTATFVARSSNYVHEGGQVVRELTINVIE